mgnify:CR=1 FL=1
MRKSFFITLLIIVSSAAALAQDTAKTNQKKFMQITTVESVLAGGSGRSKMIITNPDGSQKESDMDNLFSIAGINFKNIKSNEARIVSILKDYTNRGWKIEQVTSLTLSPNDNGSGGIFMTRYLLSKNE